MLWTIFVILVVLWLVGLVTAYTLGGLIHLLLVIAVVASQPGKQPDQTAGTTELPKPVYIPKEIVPVVPLGPANLTLDEQSRVLNHKRELNLTLTEVHTLSTAYRLGGRTPITE